MPRLNKFIDVLESGETAFCCVLQTSDIYSARRLGESPAHAVMIDFEHEAFDFPALGNTLQWLQSRRQIIRHGADVISPTPLVRMPEVGGDHFIIKQTLDYGVCGLIVPHTQTAEQLAHVVSSARYPQVRGVEGPKGHRGVSPFVAPRYWGIETFEEYVTRADLWPLNPDGELIIIAMIEDSTGFDNIEEIVKVPGLGAVLFGPGDGSRSLGLRRNFKHPDLLLARSRVVDACLAAGVKVGLAGVDDYEDYEASVKQGFSFFLFFEEHSLGLMTRATKVQAPDPFARTPEKTKDDSSGS